MLLTSMRKICLLLLLILFMGDTSQHLLTPDKELKTDHGKDTTKFQLGKPSFLGVA